MTSNSYFRAVTVVIAAGLVTALCAPAEAESPRELLATIKTVAPQGKGNEAAAEALRQLTQADGDVLPAILTAFDGATPLAANWLRNAFETIADGDIRRNRKLPAAELEQFILDRQGDPRARRLAYEWLVKVDDSAEERLIPQMLHDPNPVFRRDAVARLIQRADRLRNGGQTQEAKLVYREALSGAVDDDQVKAVVKPLRELGEKVDLQRHFGFLTRWHWIGPFDHRDGIGFDAVYPPEQRVDLQAVYAGRDGEVHWQPISTDHEYGLIDCNKQIKPYHGAVIYFAAEFVSSENQRVELRLGTPNAWKLWVNGKFLFGREEYHRGMKLDQYRVDAPMKPGRNVILLKLCQNEQTEDWAQRYQFQLRVCDETGAAVLTQPVRISSATDDDPASTPPSTAKGAQ